MGKMLVQLITGILSLGTVHSLKFMDVATSLQNELRVTPGGLIAEAPGTTNCFKFCDHEAYTKVKQCLRDKIPRPFYCVKGEIVIAEGKPPLKAFADGNEMYAAIRKYLGPNGELTPANYMDKIEVEETYGPIQFWNTSQVTSFYAEDYKAGIFQDMTYFSANIGCWDTRKVTNMRSTFHNAKSFNSGINTWSVGKVTDMRNMFFNAEKFNTVLNAWNTRAVTNMKGMFYGATSFDSNIGSWNVANVKNMYKMFSKAKTFNKPITHWLVQNVQNMAGMFEEAWSYKGQAIHVWQPSSAVYMHWMFRDAVTFSWDVGLWDTSSVVNMKGMFQGAYSFNQGLSKWDVSKVESFTKMFDGATAFNKPLNAWNTASAISMKAMFRDAIAFNQPLSNWNTSKVKFMHFMFERASSFNQNLGCWDTANVKDMKLMFYEAVSFNQNPDDINCPMNSWNVSNVWMWGWNVTNNQKTRTPGDGKEGFKSMFDGTLMCDKLPVWFYNFTGACTYDERGSVSHPSRVGRAKGKENGPADCSTFATDERTCTQAGCEWFYDDGTGYDPISKVSFNGTEVKKCYDPRKLP